MSTTLAMEKSYNSDSPYGGFTNKNPDPISQFVKHHVLRIAASDSRPDGSCNIVSDILPAQGKESSNQSLI